MAAPPPLDPALVRDVVRRALAEDVESGDVTTEALFDPRQRAIGRIHVKEPCVIAGLPVFLEAFRQLDAGVVARFHVAEGEAAGAGAIIGEVTGAVRALLTAERTALNFLQHLSGIATRARAYVSAAGGRLTVLDTRKTTPLLRALEKYAVRTGGATNHRRSLADGVLIKDNHLRLAGGIRVAVERVRAAQPALPVEVEVETLSEVDEALAAGADILLLDNMPLDEMREAVRRSGGRARTEVSGGVTLPRIPEIAASGADYVSVGALTHSAPAIDISFEIEPL